MRNSLLASVFGLALVSGAVWAAPPTYLVYELPYDADIPYTWTDLNDACEVAGYLSDIQTTPIYYQGEGILFQLASPTNGAQKLGFLLPGNNQWHVSEAYDITETGRIVGYSRDADSGNYKAVELLRPPGAGVSIFGEQRAFGMNSAGTRVLIENADVAYIHSPASTWYALNTEIHGSSAMNDTGQVVMAESVEATGAKNVYLCEVPSSSLVKTLVPALSAANPYGINIRAMNDKRTVAGERTLGGTYYPFMYSIPSNTLRHAPSAGGEFRDINEGNIVVGERSISSSPATVFVEPSGSNNVTIYNLNNHLAASASGISVRGGHAINNQMVILSEILGGDLDVGSAYSRGPDPRDREPGDIHRRRQSGRTQREHLQRDGKRRRHGNVRRRAGRGRLGWVL